MTTQNKGHGFATVAYDQWWPMTTNCVTTVALSFLNGHNDFTFREKTICDTLFSCCYILMRPLYFRLFIVDSLRFPYMSFFLLIKWDVVVLVKKKKKKSISQSAWGQLIQIPNDLYFYLLSQLQKRIYIHI